MLFYRALLQALSVVFRAEYGAGICRPSLPTRGARAWTRGGGRSGAVRLPTSSRTRCPSTPTSCGRISATRRVRSCGRRASRPRRSCRGGWHRRDDRGVLVADHVLLRPLPFPESDRLVQSGRTSRAATDEWSCRPEIIATGRRRAHRSTGWPRSRRDPRTCRAHVSLSTSRRRSSTQASFPFWALHLRADECSTRRTIARVRREPFWSAMRSGNPSSGRIRLSSAESFGWTTRATPSSG